MSPDLQRFAGTCGKLWRTHRRHLPPDIKNKLATLMLSIREEFLPDPDIGPCLNVERSRSDIRGISELLAALATPDAAHPCRSSAGTLSNVRVSPPPSGDNSMTSPLLLHDLISAPTSRKEPATTLSLDSLLPDTPRCVASDRTAALLSQLQSKLRRRR